MIHGAIASVLVLGVLSALAPLPGEREGERASGSRDDVPPRAVLIEMPAGSEFTRRQGDDLPLTPEGLSRPGMSDLGGIAPVAASGGEDPPQSPADRAGRPALGAEEPAPLPGGMAAPEIAPLSETSGAGLRTPAPAQAQAERARSPRLDQPAERPGLADSAPSRPLGAEAPGMADPEPADAPTEDSPAAPGSDPGSDADFDPRPAPSPAAVSVLAPAAEADPEEAADSSPEPRMPDPSMKEESSASNRPDLGTPPDFRSLGLD